MRKKTLQEEEKNVTKLSIVYLLSQLSSIFKLTKVAYTLSTYAVGQAMESLPGMPKVSHILLGLLTCETFKTTIHPTCTCTYKH